MSNRFSPKPWTRPASYLGATWEGWRVFLTRNRDSSILDEVNFDAAWEAVQDASNVDDESHGEDDTRRPQIVRESHWACGWVEWIAIHSTDAGALAEAEKLAARLDSYPVLDEYELSNRECDAAHEGWAEASIRDRIHALKHCYGYGKERRIDVATLLQARRDTFPEDDNGSLFDYFADRN